MVLTNDQNVQRLVLFIRTVDRGCGAPGESANYAVTLMFDGPKGTAFLNTILGGVGASKLDNVADELLAACDQTLQDWEKARTRSRLK
jgi:hypothetical protein